MIIFFFISFFFLGKMRGIEGFFDSGFLLFYVNCICVDDDDSNANFDRIFF